MYESYNDPKNYDYTHVKFNDGTFGEHNGIKEISTQEMLDMDVGNKLSDVQVENMPCE